MGISAQILDVADWISLRTIALRKSLEHTYSSSMMIRDVALKTCQRRWTIGKSGERRSGISVLAARHDDDDDDDESSYG